ncbi:ABC transporter ATP-binding protein [Paenibacillus nanensis]|uniref:ABC transporter ATP-binding protein n=1 Tax=Paenibacillus nanensis TaxID=393251 RepID=A0A3A1VEY7_9BACL|nr:ABC transporter ATP-binding protein [Paenibacillus nanensis]RIX59478.1 ABC transporter ATP-binding protein [Paenibacillus nanensis]
MTGAPAVQFRNIVKAYGAKRALDGLDLALEKGKVTALLGPNGAGKTTAVSLMLHLTKPTSGEVTVDGLAPGRKELKERIGAMLQDTAAPDGLTVRETLQLFRSYYRNPLALDRLLQIAGLDKEKNRRAASLSGGQKRRLAFAVALAGDPDMIVLDEPTVGMDVESRSRFWEVVRALASSGRTILLTTHYLEEADAVADRIVVIAQGRLVADGTPDELKASMPMRSLSFKARRMPAEQELLALPGVQEARVSGAFAHLKTKDTDALLGLLLGSDWGVSDLQIQSASLESVFRQLTETNNGKEKESDQ